MHEAILGLYRGNPFGERQARTLRLTVVSPPPAEPSVWLGRFSGRCHKAFQGTHTFTLDIGFSTPVIGFHFGLSLDTNGTLAFTPAASERLSAGISLSVNEGPVCGGRSSGDAYSAGLASVSITKSKSGKSVNVGIGGGWRFGYDTILSAHTYVARNRSVGACHR